MEDRIYLILKYLCRGEEEYFDSEPSTWCDSAEDAAELLTNTLKQLKEWYPDLEVLGHDADRLHVHYHDDDGQFNDASYWVRKVTKFDRFAW